ncbi:zinc finger, CCHC-type containing protein [Tanacetum coccineum]
MTGNTVKDMTMNFRKLDKFKGHDFRRWQKKMHFLLTMLKVVYVLTTPMPELLEDATVEAIRIRAKWENDDYICRGHILNGMSDSLFDVYTNIESAKELWDSLESKYIAEDSSSKKFLLPPSWKDFKHTLKHGKDDLSLVQLGSHLRIKESLRAQDSDKGKGKEVAEPSVNMKEEGKNKNNKQNKGKKHDFKEHGKGSKDHSQDQGFGYYNNGMFMLNLNKVRDDSDSVYISSFTVVNSPLWHARLGYVHYKRMLEMFKDELIPAIDEKPDKCNKKYVITFIDDAFRFCYVYLLHAKDEALDKFRIYKTEVELQQNDLVKTLRTDRGGEYYDPVFFQSAGIIHETTAPYTPQQNGMAERKNRALKEMVNSMLSYSVVRLPDPKQKTLGEKGIDCIFVGYPEHSKTYRFYVIEPNDLVSINSIIESRDAIFDENRFSSIPRPKDIIPNSDESQRDDHSDDVPIEGSRDQVGSQYSYCYSIKEDPITYNEAMQSQDSAFWKEAIDDEIGYIMENNTWVLSDLPLVCKPLGCKWIFKRKMKVDGTIFKFKARLVIQGFRQKEGINYFDTYAPVARITTIRLLLALAAIHNLVIHQMDVKIIFLNGDLDEEVYMKQPEGFVMPGNEHKVCKLVKSLYGLKQAPKQWHQKFDEVVLSSGFLLNQSDKCVYSKFNSSGKGVIICLYVDDMLIFGTDQNQVDKTKKFLSSKFSMKDMGEADVILGIKIKRENKGIVITQSHYIEKILKKFNREDCSPVSTPTYLVEKLKPNTGKPVDQLEYSRAIRCLMYAMTSTRPDIAYAVGRLSRFTSNPSRQHWQAKTRVFKYLKGTMNYGLSYMGYPSVLKGYSDASWINHVEDSSSTSGWMFLLEGGAISWASKKQTCITGSTMESEFVALAAAGKEAEWVRNLIHEIPIWPKPIASISIRCDSAPTMAKAYSQIYNGKYRHLGVRHSMIRELIMNGVISIEFVRSQKNLADHLMKGLARDLVNKSVIGMGLKSI